VSFSDKNEWTGIAVDRFIRKSKAAILVEVEGSEEWVAQSQIDNLDDILKHLERPTSESAKVDEIVVPKWLVVENGWEDEDD